MDTFRELVKEIAPEIPNSKKQNLLNVYNRIILVEHRLVIAYDSINLCWNHTHDNTAEIDPNLI